MEGGLRDKVTVEESGKGLFEPAGETRVGDTA